MLSYEPLSAIDVSTENVIAAVDGTRDQPSRRVVPHVELLRDDGKSVPLYPGDVISAVPEFKVEVAGLLDRVLQHNHVFSLQTFRSFLYVKLHHVALGELAVPLGLDGGIMHERFPAIVQGDAAEVLGDGKPKRLRKSQVDCL